MTDKEKEAIEYFKKEIEQFQKAQESADKEIDDRSWFKKLWCEWQNDIEMRTTVLNIIEKQQAEIKDAYWKGYTTRDTEAQNICKSCKYREETEKYKYLYQKALDNTIKADRENLEKDKIIDLMAKRLVGITFSDKDNIEIIFDNKEDIKDYFKKKVEDK